MHLVDPLDKCFSEQDLIPVNTSTFIYKIILKIWHRIVSQLYPSIYIMYVLKMYF